MISEIKAIIDLLRLRQDSSKVALEIDKLRREGELANLMREKLEQDLEKTRLEIQRLQDDSLIRSRELAGGIRIATMAETHEYGAVAGADRVSARDMQHAAITSSRSPFATLFYVVMTIIGIVHLAEFAWSRLSVLMGYFRI